jgi:hypothetical protein
MIFLCVWEEGVRDCVHGVFKKRMECTHGMSMKKILTHLVYILQSKMILHIAVKREKNYTSLFFPRIFCIKPINIYVDNLYPNTHGFNFKHVTDHIDSV